MVAFKVDYFKTTIPAISVKNQSYISNFKNAAIFRFSVTYTL